MKNENYRRHLLMLFERLGLKEQTVVLQEVCEGLVVRQPKMGDTVVDDWWAYVKVDKDGENGETILMKFSNPRQCVQLSRSEVLKILDECEGEEEYDIAKLLVLSKTRDVEVEHGA